MIVAFCVYLVVMIVVFLAVGHDWIEAIPWFRSDEDWNKRMGLLSISIVPLLALIIRLLFLPRY